MSRVVQGIVILGAGGFAREVYHHMWPYGLSLQYLFVDDTTNVTELFGHRVIKDWEFPEYSKYGLPNTKYEWKFVVGVGDPKIKKIMVEKALKSGIEPIDTWVHPRALVQNAKLGKGGIICPGVVITTNITIGDYVTVNLNSTIGHDTEIGDFVNISPGCNVSGNNFIKSGVNIGTGTVTREKIVIEEGVVIGAQSCVVKNCDMSGETYLGVPARINTH